MPAKIELTCRVQYLRGEEWVTIDRDDIRLVIESDLIKEIERLGAEKKILTDCGLELVAEVERLKVLGRKILAEYKQCELTAQQEFSTYKDQWNDIWEQITIWKEELA